MELNDRINLREDRDFGGALDVMGKFISKHFMKMFKKSIKPAIKYFFLSVITIIIGAGAMIFTAQNNSSAFSNSSEPPVLFIVLGVIIILVGAVFGIIFGLTYMTSVINYIKQYVAGKSYEEINVREGMEGVNGRVFGAMFAVGFISGLGYLLCVIPGIYLAILFSLVPSVIVMENASIGDAMSRSKELIKENWWSSFGVIFIAGIVVGIVGAIVQVPMQILQAFIPLFSDDATVILIVTFSIMAIVFPVLLFVRLALQMVPFAVNAINYFRLVELREGVGAKEQMDAWDEAESDDNQPIIQ